MKIVEAFKSGSGSIGQNADNKYVAYVVNEPGEDFGNPFPVVQFAVKHFASLSQFGLPFSNLSWDVYAYGVWIITGDYKSSSEQRQTGDSSFSFNTGGGTQHITHSRETVGAWQTDATGNVVKLADPTKAKTKQGINVTPDSVEGVDIQVRKFDFKCTFYVDPKSMTRGVVDLLYIKTSCVNDDDVTINIDGVEETFPKGSLLFLGAEGSKRRGTGDWELTLNYSVSRNEDNLTIGKFSGVKKNGWDYLWVQTVPAEDAGSKTTGPQPSAVYVEKVFEYTPLSALFALSGNIVWTTPLSGVGGGLT